MEFLELDKMRFEKIITKRVLVIEVPDLGVLLPPLK